MHFTLFFFVHSRVRLSMMSVLAPASTIMFSLQTPTVTLKHFFLLIVHCKYIYRGIFIILEINHVRSAPLGIPVVLDFRLSYATFLLCFASLLAINVPPFHIYGKSVLSLDRPGLCQSAQFYRIDNRLAPCLCGDHVTGSTYQSLFLFP